MILYLGKVSGREKNRNSDVVLAISYSLAMQFTFVAAIQAACLKLIEEELLGTWHGL